MQPQSLNKPLIIRKLKSNGYDLTPQAFDNVLTYLCARQQQDLEDVLHQLIQKMNNLQITGLGYINQQIIKTCIAHTTYGQSQTQFTQKQIHSDNRMKETVFPITPYEYTLKRVLTENPPAELFNFVPTDRAKMYVRRLEKAQKNQRVEGGSVIGLISQRYDAQFKNLETYVQTHNNEIKLDMSQLTHKCLFIIEGCIYVVKGEYRGRNLDFYASSIQIPAPANLTFNFSNTLYAEAYSKAGVNMENYYQHDIIKKKLASYGIHYFEGSNKESSALVLGNVTVNEESVGKISYIVDNVPSIKVIILLLSEHKHSSIPLSFPNCAVYVIPSASNDEGPMVFPRIPLCKTPFKGATILPNPCKMSILGTNTVFFNHRYLSHLYSQTVIKSQSITQSEKLKNIGEFVFGQGNLASGLKLYWAQEEYLDLCTNQVLMVSDDSIPQGEMKLEKGGHIVSVGHFDREKSFIMYFPQFEKNRVQASKL